VKLYKC
jgi:hypothetical protein